MSSPCAHVRLALAPGVVLAVVLAVVPVVGCESEPPGLTDADCASTFWCVEQGRCSAEGDNCVATSTADCEASTDCKSKGRCVLTGGQCTAPIVTPCAQSELCSKRGYCTPGPGEACCNTDGWCCDREGNCSNG